VQAFKVAASNMIEFGGGHLLQPSSSVDAIDATVMFSAHNQDQVLGTIRASNTRIVGNALFTGGSPEFGAIDMQGGALNEPGTCQQPGWRVGIRVGEHRTGRVLADRSLTFAAAPSSSSLTGSYTSFVRCLLSGRTLGSSARS
jgi:hypothetical protein